MEVWKIRNYVLYVEVAFMKDIERIWVHVLVKIVFGHITAVLVVAHETYVVTKDFVKVINVMDNFVRPRPLVPILFIRPLRTFFLED